MAEPRKPIKPPPLPVTELQPQQSNWLKKWVDRVRGKSNEKNSFLGNCVEFIVYPMLLYFEILAADSTGCGCGCGCLLPIIIAIMGYWWIF